MESLGGDRSWFDRFVAEHAALLYYWVLIFLYLVSPKNAYNLSELIEWHAVDTYREFTDANKAILQRLPPPMVALCYYKSADLYMFDSFQTESASSGLPPRRPECDTLYDVFSNIVDDEVEHVKTMAACQTSRPALGGAAASAGSKAARSTQQQ